MMAHQGAGSLLALARKSLLSLGDFMINLL